jgi:hypothetical protein
MLEVLPISALIDTITNYYPDLKSLAVISENTVSEQKNKKILDSLFRNKGLQPEYHLIDNFKE